MMCDIFVFILISYQYPPFYTLTIPYSAVVLVPFISLPLPLSLVRSFPLPLSL